MVDEVGTIYLIHFSAPFKHARHYVGWAKQSFTVDTAERSARIKKHRSGGGARLLKAVNAAGLAWKVVRCWPGTRTQERQIKNQKGAPRLCPRCREERKY